MIDKTNREEYMDKIEKNIRARKEAIEIAELIDLAMEEYGDRFWDCFSVLIGYRVQNTKTPGDPFKQKRSRPIKQKGSRPMTDQESRTFDNQFVPFGEYSGRPIHDIPLDRLQWYADQTFVDELRRYLESDRIKRELGNVVE